jgi:tetratricopeptide (TPR) repeat protein
VVYARLGRDEEALDHLREAAAMGHQIGEAELDAAAHNDLGAILHAGNRTGDAMASYRAALTLAEQTGDRYAQARALDAWLACGATPATRARPAATGSRRWPSAPTWARPRAAAFTGAWPHSTPRRSIGRPCWGRDVRRAPPLRAGR